MYRVLLVYLNYVVYYNIHAINVGKTEISLVLFEGIFKIILFQTLAIIVTILKLYMLHILNRVEKVNRLDI